MLCISHLTWAQPVAPALRAMLDTVIEQAKEISLYRDQVDWDLLTREMYAAASDAKELYGLKPAFERMFNALKDHHGAVRKLSDYSILASLTDYENTPRQDQRARDPAIWQVVNDVEARFTAALLPGPIGYLRVVGVGPNVDGQQEAKRIRAALTSLRHQDVRKWILDLRYTGGGNVNVMLAGLAPLLDVRQVATIRGEQGEIHGAAEIKRGKFQYFGTQAFQFSKKPRIKKSKIAILTSRWTASSGELVAVAFKGQRNTRFLGEATAGFTTNNSWDVIGDEIALLLATGIYYDREGRGYPQWVEPDEPVKFEVAENWENDQGIGRAVKWLMAK